jgi:hypothetical protein
MQNMWKSYVRVHVQIEIREKDEGCGRNFRKNAIAFLSSSLFKKKAGDSRVRICKSLWSSGFDSVESIPPTYEVWRAGTSN